MTRKKDIYLTTSIPYVNARPHLGHALELVQADLLARHYRQAGHRVRLQTGTDENAFKNVLAARAAEISTEELVGRNAATFRSLVEKLEVSFDTFIRTSLDDHRRGVAEFWRRLRLEDIYTRSYDGLYCVGCEDFYLEKDLVQGRCPDHGTPPRIVEEENFFFRLSAYQSEVDRLIRSNTICIFPLARRNEVLRFIERGLQDISISRSAERSGGWGIPVPECPSQTIYVWIDALINYVSGQGFGRNDSWRSVWNSETRKIHVIGKNIWKFHAVYWPALLLSAGLPLPDEIFVHGFITENGRKISKSLGNGGNPFAYIERFTAEGLRHFLLKAISPIEDSDFSDCRIAEVYENDLANGLGNLVSRVRSLCCKSGFPGGKSPFEVGTRREVAAATEEYKFDEAARLLWTEVSRLNQDVARVKPWELLKDGKIPELHSSLAGWVEDIRQVAVGLAPFLPHTSERTLEVLSGDFIRPAALFPRIPAV